MKRQNSGFQAAKTSAASWLMEPATISGASANTSGMVSERPLSARIFQREWPPMTGDRRPYDTADAGLANGVTAIRAGLRNAVERAVIKAAPAQKLLRLRQCDHLG